MEMPGTQAPAQASAQAPAVEATATCRLYLKELRAELETHGLLEPTKLWRRKLLFWLPTFFASYLALLMLPVGLWWLLLAPLCAVAMLTMGFVGHDAGHYAL